MAKRKLKPEDEALLHALGKRMVLTIEFIENVQEFPSGADLKVLVESAVAQGDLRGMKLMARDTDELVLTLDQHEREGLEAILRKRLGVDAEAERAEMKQHVAQVIRRGSVRSEKERRRLEQYVEMLEATNGDAAEIESVRQVLRLDTQGEGTALD